MRISGSRIRQIIREETHRALQEMPYAGDLGIGRDGFEDDPDDWENMSFQAGEAGPNPNRKGAEKFARSTRFRKLAEKHLANVPGSVWIAPLIGVGRGADVDDDPSGYTQNRVRLTPLVPDGIELLERLGYEAPARVGGDDIVILYSSMTTEKGFMATPWMIFHSMFDSGDSVDRISPLFQELMDMFMQNIDPPPEIEALTGENENEWVGALTMGSARNGEVGTTTDALAEIVCQELLTKGGFQVNPGGADPEYVEALQALKPYIKRIADEVRSNMRGKLVAVAVN
jgi:hypothetical protein